MSQTYSPDASPTSYTGVLLLLVWATLTVGGIGFVFAFGSNAPFADEWAHVPVLVGDESAGPWLWGQRDHQFEPIPRSIYLSLFWLTRDFRAGSLLQVLLLSGLSLALMRHAAHVRGYASWPDAFFPITLLHLGHWENFISGYQLQAALFTVFASALVVVVLRAPRARRWQFVGLLVLVVLTCGIPLTRGQVNVDLRTVGHVLGSPFGIGFGNIWYVVVAVEVVLGFATAALLYRDQQAGPRVAFGFGAVVIGVWTLAVLAGGSPSQSSLLMWPLIAAIFLAWVRAGRKWVPVGLCLAAALAFSGNTMVGMVKANEVRAAFSQLEADALLGMSATELAGKYAAVMRTNPAHMQQAIPLLRQANIGVFAQGGSGGNSKLGWILAGLCVVLVLPVGVVWAWRLGCAVLVERARELFRLQHEKFEEQLLQAASATGLPRGLLWVRCEIIGDALLVRDTTTHEIVALVPVRIEFEPEPDSDMADNPVAHEPRPATATFTYQRGTWKTAGRVLFNHTPEQAVAAFAPRFRIIDHGGH